MLGGAFRFQDLEFYYAYSPEVRGNLDVVFDVPLDFGFAAFDVGAFDIQTAISFVPAQNRIGVLGEYQGFDYDVGLVQNQWSKFSDPFLNVDLIGSLDAFFFNEFPIQLEDTIEPYILLSKRFGDTRLGAGYSYRRNPVKDIDNNEPLVGADMHAFKFTGEQKLYVFQKSFTFGAEAVIGLMDSSKSANRTQSLDGYFVNLQSYIKVPL